METLYQLSYSPEAATNDTAADVRAHPRTRVYTDVSSAPSRQAITGASR